MPQLEVSTFPSQLFWLAICLSMLYFSISKYFIPKLQIIIDNRTNRVNDQLLDIEKMKTEIAILQENYTNKLRTVGLIIAQQQQQQLQAFNKNCEQKLNDLRQQQYYELLAIKVELDNTKKNILAEFPIEVIKLKNRFIEEFNQYNNKTFN